LREKESGVTVDYRGKCTRKKETGMPTVACLKNEANIDNPPPPKKTPKI